VATQMFLYSSLCGEMIQFDEHIFQMGWLNHQLEGHGSKRGHGFDSKTKPGHDLKTLATNVRPYDRWKWSCNPHTWLGGGFKDFLFLPLVGEDEPNIFFRWVGSTTN